MSAEPSRLLIFGAHPDDADFHAGGLAVRYRELGHTVKMISMTNGDAGHQTEFGTRLAQRRRAEAQRAGRVIGADYETWDHHDGHLKPTLALRWQVVGEIRTFRPDLVLAHRPEDYHPDHRAVGHVVRDAAYLITVPGIVPDVPIVDRVPVFGYLPDRFTRPAGLCGDVVIDIGEQFETMVDMLCCHESQMFEWLPFNQGVLDDVPEGTAARRTWIGERIAGRLRDLADRYRTELIATYGPRRGAAVELAEVFEISEYGAPLDKTARRRLFPFLPDRCEQ